LTRFFISENINCVLRQSHSGRHMGESTRYSEHLLEDLYRVYGDVGSVGRSIDFLSRSLSLPGKNTQELAKNLASQGYIKRVISGREVGYVLTLKGASYFAQRFLNVSPALIERTLSATAIVALVDYVYSRLRGWELKTVLREAFRTERYPVFQRATKARLFGLLEDNNAPFRCVYIYRLVRELLHPSRFSGEIVSQHERNSLRRVLREEGVLNELEGKTDDRPWVSPSDLKVGNARLYALRDQLVLLQDLPPQKRGLAFERFLSSLFQLFGLDPRGSFRLHGEQIDGSFEIGAEIYLLEAKWHRQPIGEAPLLVFREKVESKSTWSRGLFISYSGFTSKGIEQFSRGRATNIIGMSGQDLFLILEGRIPLVDAILKKARKAAETGQFYVPVQELLSI
jgi:hypothetical protein